MLIRNRVLRRSFGEKQSTIADCKVKSGKTPLQLGIAAPHDEMSICFCENSLAIPDCGPAFGHAAQQLRISD
jgi:hypothetical protein